MGTQNKEKISGKQPDSRFVEAETICLKIMSAVPEKTEIVNKVKGVCGTHT